MSFTTDEVWLAMGREGSVHTAYFPAAGEIGEGIGEAARKRAGNWDRLMKVRDDVLKSLETARNEKLIGAPLEARVRLSANGDLFPLLRDYAGDLPGLFIVSEVGLERAEGDAPFEVARGARGGRQVRALLEVHFGCRLEREVPHDLRLVRGGGGRDFEWLICAGKRTRRRGRYWRSTASPSG